MPEEEPTTEEAAAAEEAEYLEDHPYRDVPRVTGEDASSVLNMQRIQRPTASVIVGVMDVVLPIVIALIFKGSESDTLKLDDGERDTLTDAWTAYLGDKNVQASPGAVLLTTIATIYGAKVFLAFQQKKEADRQRIIDDQNAELKRLHLENELLKRQAAEKAEEGNEKVRNK